MFLVGSGAGNIYSNAVSPTRVEQQARISGGPGDFSESDSRPEHRLMKDHSRESFNSSLKQPKGLKFSNASSKAQSKLPPSIRWASTDDDPELDFFGKDLDVNYQRNPKAIAQLAPLASNAKHALSTLNPDPDPRISLNNLNLKKKGKLKPLRD